MKFNGDINSTVIIKTYVIQKIWAYFQTIPQILMVYTFLSSKLYKYKHWLTNCPINLQTLGIYIYRYIVPYQWNTLQRLKVFSLPAFSQCLLLVPHFFYSCYCKFVWKNWTVLVCDMLFNWVTLLSCLINRW